jgi:transcriptional regulator with XRE-family HTH domain
MSFEISEQVGRNISSARRRAGLTQEQLSRRASIRQNDISRLERGHYSPHLATLVRLAGALETPVAELLHGIEGDATS